MNRAVVWLWADDLLDGITAEVHTIFPVTPGDYDLDGDIDAQDYGSWQSDYGVGGYSDADGNRDGSIDAADYVRWRKNLAAAVADPAATVPEPTSTTLGMLALVCLLPRRLARTVSIP